VEDAVKEAGATGVQDLGKVMKVLMPKLAGTGADGKAVNQLVRKRLGG
jgi:uncharacterized protein YqeY